MAGDRRRQTRANGERTRVRILDAAELLFGARGFDGVSLRDITDGAGVTLALASYHFGTKENLFEEVVARRAAELGEERLARLAAIGTPTIRAVQPSSWSGISSVSVGPLVEPLVDVSRCSRSVPQVSASEYSLPHDATMTYRSPSFGATWTCASCSAQRT